MKPVALSIFALCVASGGLQAQFPAFPTADRVLGQGNFTTDTSPATTQASMADPAGIAEDPVSGKVFVSIDSQHRIPRFASSAAVANGANAEAVIGQTDCTSASSGIGAANLNRPQGIDVDSAGRLWVADFLNHRVLRFDAAATLGDGAPATAVLGQPDFDTGTEGTTNLAMYGPTAVLLDPAGRLWVSDRANHRVLRFDAATTLANGSPANGVLGQTDFVTNATGSAPAKIGNPSALALDRKGTLYIADNDNHRVIYHRSPATKSNGATPDGVIGQPDLGTFTSGATAQKMKRPYGGLDFDTVGNLWVIDSGNHRALRFPGDFTATAPTVTGKPPKSVTSGKLSLKGTATDPNGISQVRFRVGKGPFKTAVGTTAWKLSAKLKPGKNTIEIVAVDSFGNVSPAKTVKVKRQ